MSNLVHALYGLRKMDELSRQSSPVHRLSPLSKLLATMAYLAVLTSFGRHEVVRLLPLAVYPILVAAAGGVPAGPLIKRLLVAEPMIIFIGLLNPIYEQSLVQFGPWQLGAGWLTFASIAVRGTLAVAAALVLTAVTGMDGVAAALRQIGLPRILARQLVLTYRYLSLLVEEAARALNAYRLRTGGQKGIARSAWGPMAGRLLLRTLDRGERVHQAMLLRGYDGSGLLGRQHGSGLEGLAFAAGWGLYFLLVRLADVTAWLGSLVMGRMP